MRIKRVGKNTYRKAGLFDEFETWLVLCAIAGYFCFILAMLIRG